MMKINSMVLIIFIIQVVFLIDVTNGDKLSIGFYSSSCPNAEEIVSSIVTQAVGSDNNMAAVLLRLHFHDCFVEGCDGSILIQGENAENSATGHQGVRGFEVIETAKAQLESVCEGVVSCADIVALAARDAIALSNGPAYQVPTGRRDGRVSDVLLAKDMPEVNEPIEQLKEKFRQKGLSDTDYVLLSATHTIGTTACFFMTDRLYNFGGSGGFDPSINPQLLPELMTKCPLGGDVNVRLPLDHGSEFKFDMNILENIRTGFAVLSSDARLLEDESTRSVIDSYVGSTSNPSGPSFESDFVASIVKMGLIDVKTGSEGEIRSVCKAFN